jgi:hypothetical protein
MLRFSTTLPGMTRSGHRRAGITIAVGLTGTSAPSVSSLRTMASLRRGMTQLQQTRATTVCLGSLPRTVASLRRASTVPPASTNPEDHKLMFYFIFAAMGSFLVFMVVHKYCEAEQRKREQEMVAAVCDVIVVATLAEMFVAYLLFWYCFLLAIFEPAK